MPQRANRDRRNAIKAGIREVIHEHASGADRISDAIWSYAELPMQETRSSELLASHLEAAGFDVTRGVAGMPTAFTATYARGTGRPAIGILAEYDALPSLSQRAGGLRHEPIVEGAPGHGCTHCAMAATSILTAVAVKEAMDAQHLDGTVTLFGCPGEEALVSRPYMVRAGLFEGLDAVLDNHGSDTFRSMAGVSNSGMYSFEVVFHGRTAHAAGDPWHGIGALHAVELMNHAVNMLREHLHYTARVHCVIPDGGKSPNVVPDRASVWYYVRDNDERLAEDFRKVLRCAEGAAIATGCTHEVRIFTGIHQNYLNRSLADVMHENMHAAGMPDWSSEDHRFVKAFQRTNALKRKPLPEKPKPVLVGKPKAFTGAGSSDVGEVSLVAPTSTLLFPAIPPGTCGHHWQAVSLSGTPIAHRAITTAAHVLAGTAIDLLLDPAKRGAIREEFGRLQKRMPYESYLPEDAEPPINLNREAMDRLRPLMEPHYYDPRANEPLMTAYGFEKGETA